MRVAFSYKGTFNIDYIKKYGIDNNIKEEVKKTIENNLLKIFKIFDKLNIEYDTFISTYKFDNDIDGRWIREIKPVKFYCGDPDYTTPTYIPQFNHFKRLIEMINNQEKISNKKYDIFIFTRLDIKMLKDYDELNIDYDKFNIVFKNESGGCDDNFFIFPRKYYEHFIETIKDMHNNNEITHSINSWLEKKSVLINYMDNFNKNIYMGHNSFEFVRCGKDPNDVFSINSNFKR